MKKQISSDFIKLSIFDLKEWGYLNQNQKKGVISWTKNGNDKYEIGIRSNTKKRNGIYIKTIYSININNTDWEKIIQKHFLVTTSCNFGGKRYWFKCGNINCRKKVAKLYLGGGSKYFYCRHCHNLTYKSRIYGYAYTESDLNDHKRKMKRKYYNGKMTKKYVSYLNKKASIARYWINLAKKLN